MTVPYYFLSNQPVKGSAFSFIMGLYSQADTKLLQDNPTLAAGDVKVIKDGVYDDNIDALPVAIAGVTRALLVTVSATENDCNYGGLVFNDVTGSQWCDAIVYWSTVQAVGVGTSDYAGGAVQSVTNPVTVTGTVASDVVLWRTSQPNTLQSGRVDAYVGAILASVINSIADQNWDELLAGHVIAGSAGAMLTTAGADPFLNAVPGTYLGGTAGAALGRIGSGQISTTSIVAQSGDTTTYRGDDYNNTDARRIDWTDVSANWPVLTTATILVVIGGDISFAGTVITATGTGKKVGVELTAAQTLTIPQGILDFVVRATLSSGRVVTLVEGKWTSKKQLTVGS